MHKKTYEQAATDGKNMLAKKGDAELYTVNEIPKPAKYLTKNGQRIYRQICTHLRLHNSLCEIDSHYVSGVARSLDVYIRMVTTIEEREAINPGSGYFQISPNGYENFSAAYNLQKNEWAAFADGCKALGLNLKARDTITAYAKSNDGSDDGDEDELNLN